jgi:hypothetical protein
MFFLFGGVDDPKSAKRSINQTVPMHEYGPPPKMDRIVQRVLRAIRHPQSLLQYKYLSTSNPALLRWLGADPVTEKLRADLTRMLSSTEFSCYRVQEQDPPMAVQVPDHTGALTDAQQRQILRATVALLRAQAVPSTAALHVANDQPLPQPVDPAMDAINNGTALLSLQFCAQLTAYCSLSDGDTDVGEGLFCRGGTVCGCSVL